LPAVQHIPSASAACCAAAQRTIRLGQFVFFGQLFLIFLLGRRIFAPVTDFFLAREHVTHVPSLLKSLTCFPLFPPIFALPSFQRWQLWAYFLGLHAFSFPRTVSLAVFVCSSMVGPDVIRFGVVYARDDPLTKSSTPFPARPF